MGHYSVQYLCHVGRVHMVGTLEGYHVFLVLYFLFAFATDLLTL